MKIIDIVMKYLPEFALKIGAFVRYEDRVFLFYGLGTYIRNKYLKQGSELYEAFCEYGVFDPDDQSAFVIDLLYFYLKENKR